MSEVGELAAGRKERPAYVRFERRAIEDRTAASVNGRWPKKDVDYALVTPPYSRDVFEQVASEWLAQMDAESQAGRLPGEWAERYRQQYEKWQQGEEMPLNGEPVKGWNVISPAQQANLIAIGIRTVEDLAAVNEEGLRRIGMGAVELRDKAKAWLSQMNDKAPLTQENAALKSENTMLKATNANLEARVRELTERVDILQRGVSGLERLANVERPSQSGDSISVADVMPEETLPPKRSRRGATQQDAI
jgi:hypothetical protein